MVFDQALAYHGSKGEKWKSLKTKPNGRPGDEAQQRRVLGAALALLEQDAPLEPLYLEERVT